MEKKNIKKISKKTYLPKVSKWWIAGSLLILAIFTNIFSGGKILSINRIYRQVSPTSIPTLIPIPIVLEIVTPGSDSTREMYIEMAQKDLSKKLGIDIKEIRISRTETVEWSDTGLGCPDKNSLYAQVITSGFTIDLWAGGQIYNYHAGLDRVVDCKGY